MLSYGLKELAKTLGVAGPIGDFFSDRHWCEPLRWNRLAEKEQVHRMVFCASMTGVFEPRKELGRSCASRSYFTIYAAY
jgi:hypothetical protein